MLLPCEDRSPGSLAGTECRGPPPRPRAPAATLSPVRREQRTHRAESQTQDSNPALLILNPALLCLALSGPCIHDRGMKKRLGDGPHDSKAYRHSHSHFPSDLVVESPGHLKKKKKDEGPSLCPGQPAADVGARFSTCREAGRNKLSPTRAPPPPWGGQGHGRGMGRAMPGAPTRDPRNRWYLGKPTPPSPECLHYGCRLILTHTW